MKKILSVITSAVLCFSAAAMPCVSAAQLSMPEGVVSEYRTDASGTCGTNVSWELKGGTLTISGSGKMVEWQSTKYVPWKDYIGEIRSVVIGSGVTNVGRGAFYKASNLSSVSIPSTVTEISASAFQESGIQSITLPSSVVSVGVDSFKDCGQLREIKIFNSKCVINGGTSTISGSATIYAPAGSLAQQYASDFNHNFSVLSGSEPTQPTQPATTTTSRTTTTTTSRTTTSRTTTTTTSRTTTTTTSIASTTTSSEVTVPPMTWTNTPECKLVGVAAYPTKSVYTEGEELSFDGLVLTLHTVTFYESLENSWWVTGDDFEYEFEPSMNLVTITSSNGKTYDGAEFSNLPAGKYNVRVKGYVGQIMTKGVFGTLKDVDFAYDVTINAKETTTTATTTNAPQITTYTLRIEVASMPEKTEYQVGEAFSLYGLRIRSFIKRGEQPEVEESASLDPLSFPGSFDISEPDMSTPGIKTVTVEMHRYNPEISNTVRAYTTFNISVGDSRQYNDKLGDANLDGIVDGRDATLVLTEYARSSTGGGAAFDSSPRAKAVADVDRNNIIDGRDATSILTYYAYISVDGNPQVDMKTWYDSNNR